MPRSRRYAAVLALGLGVLAVPAAAETVRIMQKGKEFSAREITIAVGDSVEFVNDDDTAHNVMSYSEGFAFDLKLQRPGESKTIAFDKPGRVEIECDIHPKMGLVINVGE